jgi:single-stranded-DNA-specific exonuclease
MSSKSSVPYRTSVSAAFKKIRLREQDAAMAESIAQEFKVTPVTARILSARGYKVDDTLKNYIRPTLKDGLPGPQALKNLDAACELIRDTIRANRGIGICCDFDVDGLSGGSQVFHFLKSIGANVKIYVPDRFADGYGLNEKMIRDIAERKFGLVITIDFGTTNIKELTIARELGLKTIVIDHHHVGDTVSPSDVFINPNQKGCGFAGATLCAAGLAWYLVLGLKKFLPEAANIDPKNYLDLACLGTICDMVPLTGVNRILAKRGLELLTKTNRVGLRALKNVAGIHGEVECSHVGFGIGPRLNAAGRMVHGEVVVDLLTTEDTILADKLAQSLNRLNLERQDEELRVKEVAVKKIQQLPRLPAGLVVWEENFHTGVIGIVAQRLVETFYRPAVVLGVDTEGIFKGSVRGIKGFSVVGALQAVSKHLIKFGGHEGAGGLSVSKENLNKFADAFIAECDTRLRTLETEPHVEADTEAGLADIEPRLVDELKQLAPFGMGNPNPHLLVQKLKVMDVKSLKGLHIKATLSDGTRFITGLLWRHAEHPALKAGNTVNIVCKPDISTYLGNVEVVANLAAVEKV